MLTTSWCELLQTWIWFDSWSCAWLCLYCTPTRVWEESKASLRSSAAHAGAHSDQSQHQIFKDADLIHCPSSHTAEAAFKHADRCWSLAGNVNACVGLSAGAAQPLTFTVCLQEWDRSVQQSYGSESFWDSLCVLPLPDSPTLHFFASWIIRTKLHSLSCRSFPSFLGPSVVHHACLAFLQVRRMQSRWGAPVSHCVRKPMKDPLFSFSCFLSSESLTASADLQLPFQMEGISFPCLLNLPK